MTSSISDFITPLERSIPFMVNISKIFILNMVISFTHRSAERCVKMDVFFQITDIKKRLIT